jgi:glycerol-1-phosphate dehydrogenase [NAD(P)+]
MSLDLSIADLSNLERIDAALKQNDPKGQFADLGLKEVIIAENTLEVLPEVISRHLIAAGHSGQGADIRVVVDPVLILRAGRDLKTQVVDLLSKTHSVTRVVMDDGEDVLHADEPILAGAAEFVVGADCIVSIGGGTITDVAKVAAVRSNIPVHVVIQTAASVDGFTDNFSVVLQNGVKKTSLSRWPEAVLCDIRTIAEAPAFLTAAGMGEMMSMFCAPGDWYLATQLGVDDTFTPVLLELLAICGGGIEEWSKGLATGDVNDSESLASALALRGIVTGVGGTTATLSGMEHLFSHMLDMVAGERGTPMSQHGAQVGVGSIIRAAAWEVFCERMAETPIDASALEFDLASQIEVARANFADLDPSGAIGAECAQRFETKLTALQKSWPQVVGFFENWEEHRKGQNELVFDTPKIADYLARAKSPMRFDDLKPAPTEDLVRWVLASCQFMRERLTIADLLYLAGWLDEAGVERIMTRVDAVIAQTRGE